MNEDLLGKSLFVLLGEPAKCGQLLIFLATQNGPQSLRDLCTTQY
jgi:hypothetical protein